MPSARTSRRGAFLNWRFAVYGIQNAACSRSAAGVGSSGTRLFTATTLLGEGHDLLALLAQAADAERHDVARLEEHRIRLDAHADPGRRAGGNDVAGQQRHVVADVRHDLRAAEDHGARVARLHALAVDVEPHLQALRVGDLVGGDEPGPDRPGGVEALAFVPLAGDELEGALGHVVHHAVAGDVVERFFLLDVLRLGADDDAEFHLPVELGRALGLNHVVVRAVDAVGGLHEYDRLRRDRHAGVLGMVLV